MTDTCGLINSSERPKPKTQQYFTCWTKSWNSPNSSTDRWIWRPDAMHCTQHRCAPAVRSMPSWRKCWPFCFVHTHGIDCNSFHYSNRCDWNGPIDGPNWTHLWFGSASRPSYASAAALSTENDRNDWRRCALRAHRRWFAVAYPLHQRYLSKYPIACRWPEIRRRTSGSPWTNWGSTACMWHFDSRFARLFHGGPARLDSCHGMPKSHALRISLIR